MSPTIQLEIWKRFEPTTTAQVSEKTRRPAARRRSVRSGTRRPQGVTCRRQGVAGRFRGSPVRSCASAVARPASATPVPASTIAGIVTWLNRKTLLNDAAMHTDRNDPNSPAPSQPGARASRTAVARTNARPSRPTKTPCLGEEAEPLVVRRVEGRVAELDRQLAICPVALPDEWLVEEHPPGSGPRRQPLLVAGDEQLSRNDLAAERLAPDRQVPRHEGSSTHDPDHEQARSRADARSASR